MSDDQLRLVTTDQDGNHTYLRHDASETQKQAALNVFPRTGTIRKQVLGVIWRGEPYGRTRDEIARIMDWNPNTVRPRVKELIDGGWVVASGTRENASGQACEVLHLSEAAKEEINRRLGRRAA